MTLLAEKGEHASGPGIAGPLEAFRLHVEQDVVVRGNGPVVAIDEDFEPVDGGAQLSMTGMTSCA